MKTLETKLIIYDGNCKVCSSLRRIVLKLTSIGEDKIPAYTELSPELRAKVDHHQFKNGMAVIDTDGGETIYGAAGVAYIFSSQYKAFEILLKFKPFYYLFTSFYKIQAYNRYIIARPKSDVKCDCLPDRIVKYRVAYLALTISISILLTCLFGISLRNFFDAISPLEAAVQMLLIAGTGWVIQITFALLLLKGKALDYIGNLGSIMVVGLLILVPWLLFHSITGIDNRILPAISVLLSSCYMLYLHVRRANYLELSQAWTLSWFLLLQATAAFWVYYFYIKYF